MKKILSILFLGLLATASFAQKKAPAKKPAVKKTEPTTNIAPVQVNSMVDEVKVPVVAKKKQKVPPKDGFYTRKDIDSTVMVPFADVREEDVFYAKRIWREIDLRDTVNSVLKSPKSRLIDVIISSIKAEELTAYSPVDSALNEDDAFHTPLEADSAFKMALGTTEVTDNKSGTVRAAVNDFNPDLFLKFRVKEDWIFDVKRSIFEPRSGGR